MSTFIDVVNSALTRVNEDPTDADAEVLQVIKDGINEGYLILASNVDQRTKDLSFSYVKGYVLPDDFVSIVNISHNTLGDLSDKDYEKIANLLYIRAKDAQSGTITLKYIYLPTLLTADTDAINLKSIYMQALIVYVAYAYYVYRKKTDVANMFYTEFVMLTGINGGGNNKA